FVCLFAFIMIKLYFAVDGPCFCFCSEKKERSEGKKKKKERKKKTCFTLYLLATSPYLLTTFTRSLKPVRRIARQSTSTPAQHPQARRSHSTSAAFCLRRPLTARSLTSAPLSSTLLSRSATPK